MGFFKSITKSIKKAAPIIGATIGYGLGGPAGGALFSAIGGGIGGLVAGQDVDEALRTAAISGIAGYGVGKFAGNTQFAPGFLKSGAAPAATGAAPAATGATQAAASAPLSSATTSAAGVQSAPLVQTSQGFILDPGAAASTVSADVAAASQSPGIMGFIAENPITSASLGLTGLGALGAFDEEQEEFEGTTSRPFPIGEQLDINVVGEDGEILNLADADDARRYRESLEKATRRAAGGEVVGPGTGTSDSVPARLSDGEFVLTAKAVRGAGGGDRDIGAARMYDMMADLEAVG